MHDLQNPLNSGFVRRSEPILRYAIVTLAMACIALPVVPEGQRPMTGQQSQSVYGDLGDLDPVLAKRQLRLLNVERQKKIVSDADKLLALARALNSEIEKANSGSMTPEQMHKIAEIEKLAKNVKTNMTITVGGDSLTPAVIP